MLSVTTPTYNTHLYVYAQSSVLLKKITIAPLHPGTFSVLHGGVMFYSKLCCDGLCEFNYISMRIKTAGATLPGRMVDAASKLDAVSCAPSSK